MSRSSDERTPTTTRSGCVNDLDRLAEPQVLRRSTRSRPVGHEPARNMLLEPRGRADGQLRRDSTSAPSREMRKQLRRALDDVVHVRPVVVVDRRVERDPDDVGAATAAATSVVKWRRPLARPASIEIVESGLEQRRTCPPAQRPATSAGSKSSPSRRGRRGAGTPPSPCPRCQRPSDADVHARSSSSQGFACRYSSVLMMPSRIDNRRSSSRATRICGSRGR